MSDFAMPPDSWYEPPLLDDACEECGGDGEIRWNRTSPRDPQFDEFAKCPRCGGNCVEPSFYPIEKEA